MNNLTVLDLDDTITGTTVGIREGSTDLTNLTMTPGAFEFLQLVQHPVLLTAGDPFWQDAKIDRFGIRPHFKEVIIVQTRLGKENALRRLVAAHRASGNAPVIVIGDRCDMEIRMGKLLGCYTVRMTLPGGKYALRQPRDEYECADFSATDFYQVTEHLRSLDFL